MALSELWAKTDPFQSVITHGIASGMVAQALLTHTVCPGSRRLLAEGLSLQEAQLNPFVGYFVSLHDIGKINYYFQSRLEGTEEKLQAAQLSCAKIPGMHFRHEQESVLALKRIWGEIDRRNGTKLADIIGAHHQGKPRQFHQPTAQGPWVLLQQQFEGEMRRFFLGEAAGFPQLKKSGESAVSALLLGLLILADWIASSAYFAKAGQWLATEGELASRAEAFLQESGLAQAQIDFGAAFHQVWPNIPIGSQRELQKQTELLFENPQRRYALVLIEAPMGEGKTEAGTYAALRMGQQWGKNGIYVALPTAATANQMVDRMRRLLKLHHADETVKLLHATAWMVDGCPAQCQRYSTEEEAYARNWLLPLRRGLLAGYAVGTVDQAMMAAMFVKYGVLRLFGLAGKTLIIDEIHAYDTYMQSILEGLLAWCRALEIPVVLLSATLPPGKKQRLFRVYSNEPVTGKYPGITAVGQDQTIRWLPIEHVAMEQQYWVEKLPILYDAEKIACAAAAKVQAGGCLCVILNTVAQAQAAYLAIQSKGFAGQLLLFHSRFPAERRQVIEKQCLQLFGKDKTRRPAKGILIATQVIEQSLDVDFDYMLSAVAPMDLLLQRLGRQFRHRDTPRPDGLAAPVLSVLLPQDGRYRGDAAVYPECLLQQAARLLEKRTSIRIPEDVAQLVADGYDGAKVPPAELEKWMEALVEEEVRGAAAERYKLWGPEKRFRPLVEAAAYDDLEQQSYLSAQTRLSAPTVRVAIVEEDLYGKILSMAQNGTLSTMDLSFARQILGRSLSIRKKVYDRFAPKFGREEITGEGLLCGIKIIPRNNPCFIVDDRLGVLWKEEIR